MVNALTTYARRYAAIIALLITIAFLAAITNGNVGLMQTTVNDAFGGVVGFMASGWWPEALETQSWRFGIPGLFWSIPWIEVPLVVMVLAGGAIFFTFRFSFINLRGAVHAVNIVRGKYDDPDAPGDVSHFQALSSALSATVGLGNIAGVAIAVSVGGPGAVFWMMVAALFGMTSKFTECTLGQMYRQVDENGEVRGGPMVYLKEGLAEMGFGTFGRVLSVIFAVLCIGGSFGGGNMFQSNQSFQAMTSLIPALGGEKATSIVRVHADTPQDLDFRRHLVRFERAADAEAGTEALAFLPVADVKFAAADWEQDREGGRYFVDIEAVASQSGEAFNVAKGSVRSVSFGVVSADRKVTWSTPAGVSLLSCAGLVARRGSWWVFCSSKVSSSQPASSIAQAIR